MATSQYLAVDYVESYNLLRSSGPSPLVRRRSFGELDKLTDTTPRPTPSLVPSPNMMRVSNLPDDKKKWTSSELSITDSEIIFKIPKIIENQEWDGEEKVKEDVTETSREVNEEMAEDAIFLEFQRCAMATRRRKSFNDKKCKGGDTESNNEVDPCRSGAYHNTSTETPSETLSVQSPRRTSVYLTTPAGISMESLSTQSSPRSSIYVVAEEDDRVVLAPNSGWNRLKRMFKEHKLKEQSINYTNKQNPSYHLRRGSCDSQLMSARAHSKSPLPERSSVPDTIFSSCVFEGTNEEDVQPLTTKTDGWARLKKKFKEGKLKPMMDEVSTNGKCVKNESNNNNNNNSTITRVDSSSHKSNGNGAKKIKKATKADITGKNALHNAIVEGDLTAVKRIIESGKIDINFLKPPGLTPLHVACAFGNLKIIEQLISNGADVQIKTWSRISSLQVSTLFGHFEVCQYLISKGASSMDVQDGFVHDIKLMSSVLVK